MDESIHVPNDSNMEIDEDMSGEDSNDAIMDSVVAKINIVPSGRLNISRGSPTFATCRPNIALPPGEALDSLVPYEQSTEIVRVEERPPKRHRTQYEQVNAALEAPATYEEAIQCGESSFWRKAIDQELSALAKKQTWNIMDRNPK
uniref:AlNc14C80G5278 protein n=1 Tax=Albugo laibachii Nc14 TaxID=890382 RepID=F0WF86_9STRA|nr:AlNc14C80G5278 [Albugo laibachii Nc14]|eukprot:CCA19868.1 AlNc14C80G5278 [Albugo laibachii Nc14]